MGKAGHLVATGRDFLLLLLGLVGYKLQVSHFFSSSFDNPTSGFWLWYFLTK